MGRLLAMVVVLILFFSGNCMALTVDQTIEVFSKIYNSKFREMAQDPKLTKIEVPIKGKDWSVDVYTLDFRVGKQEGKMPVFVLNLGGKEYVTSMLMRVSDAKMMTGIWGFESFPQKELKGKKAALLWEPEDGECRHDIAVFSDPECPFCRQFVPHFLSWAQEKDFCFYHYFFPLSFHKNALKLSRYLVVLLNHAPGEQKADIFRKFYSLAGNPDDAEKYAVKTASQFGLSKVEFYKEASGSADEHIQEQQEMGKELRISGTPTVFLDGRRVNNSMVRDLVDWLSER